MKTRVTFAGVVCLVALAGVLTTVDAAAGEGWRDMNGDGVVDAVDVQLAANEALELAEVAGPAKGVAAGPAAVVRVDAANTSGVEDGLSWATAFDTIQEGIGAASAAGDAEVWVRAGVYDEARTSNLTGVNTGSVVMAPNVALYGGFDGTESVREDRDWEANETTIDGSVSRDGQPAFHVVWGGYGARIDGFTITGGVANGGAPGELGLDTIGAGVLCWGTDNDIANCTFIDNSGEYGAALSIVSNSPEVINCTFDDNTGGGGAGGIFCFNGSPVFSGCTISNNSGGYSGGLDIWSGAPVFTACTFAGNDGVHGGAVFAWSAQPAFAQCTFAGNFAALGAAVFLYATETEMSRCMLDSNQGFYGGAVSNWYGMNAFSNCVVAGNSAHLGGGMFNVGIWPVLTHCTLTGNTAAAAGGALFSSDSAPMVDSCVLWGNAPNQLSDSGGTTSVRYSDVQGGWPGSGNINADPEFVPGGYTLAATSTCIDAASDTAETDDFLGTARPQGLASDMGAYEWNPSAQILMVASVSGTTGMQVSVPVYLDRPATLSEGSPSVISASLGFNKDVLRFVQFQPSSRLSQWYGKSLQTSDQSVGASGLMRFVVSGGITTLFGGVVSTEITTFDDQRVGGTPANQEDPFLIGWVVFNVDGGAGATSGLTLSTVAMADRGANRLSYGVRNGTFTATSAAGKALAPAS